MNYVRYRGVVTNIPEDLGRKTGFPEEQIELEGKDMSMVSREVINILIYARVFHETK